MLLHERLKKHENSKAQILVISPKNLLPRLISIEHAHEYTSCSWILSYNSHTNTAQEPYFLIFDFFFKLPAGDASDDYYARRMSQGHFTLLKL